MIESLAGLDPNALEQRAEDSPPAYSGPLRELALLRRQEGLLNEALSAGHLPREQRRVQRRLLTETRQGIAVQERIVRVLDAGWEPVQPAAGWDWGYVEDPRYLAGRVRVAAVALAAPLAVLAGVLLARGLYAELLAAAVSAGVIGLAFQTVVHGILSGLAERRDARRTVAGDSSEILLFNAPLPAMPALAYRRAKASGLFDELVVYSPRAEDFRAISASQAPSLGLLDPLLVGRIGSQAFLLAQWDLGRDLAPSA